MRLNCAVSTLIAAATAGVSRRLDCLGLGLGLGFFFSLSRLFVGAADVDVPQSSTTDSTEGQHGHHGRQLSSRCPNDGNWVDCVNGFDADSPCFQNGGTCYGYAGSCTLSTGDTTCIPCFDTCDGDCCIGGGACEITTACIKKDGSCDGPTACHLAGDGGNTQLQISGPSCVGDDACKSMFYFYQNTGVIKVERSCLCDASCEDHCSSTPATPLPGLPACGESLCNAVGQTGDDTCETPSTKTCKSSKASKRPRSTKAPKSTKALKSF